MEGEAAQAVATVAISAAMTWVLGSASRTLLDSAANEATWAAAPGSLPTMGNGAYVAAANRAQQAISQFSQTPSVEEALYILIASYDKLEMPGLRDAAERVLRQNFPESEYLTKGLLARKTPWYRF